MSTDHQDPISLPERCKAKRAAEILSTPYPGTFNRRRRQMQMVWNRETESPEPYPNLTSADERRAFNEDHILVVPEWGGISHFGGVWTYSVEKCQAWARGDALANPAD